ncbi:eukaryotic translation initiation factor 5-like [Paramacrobiotus metropolitanus]|uniref:eukaryotic translation initiation factor 5-like n=1 Tax=Paramacrobiotus metropolitanus TaxID=2943436 RepID=UPI002445F6CA|nr:eukaryotic translation initiation factor 5-like [Paramacrobiotus metropolitanus]
MTLINIDRSNPDQFCRYKMPRLVAKVERCRNKKDRKTIVVNLKEIAASLNRPAAYPLEYFGCELGAQAMIDSKNDRYIVKGAHDAHRLQEVLDGFITKFVLCQNCNNPTTALQVYPKKNTIEKKCTACGNSCIVDMKHKLTSYILNNPPKLELRKIPGLKRVNGVGVEVPAESVDEYLRMSFELGPQPEIIMGPTFCDFFAALWRIVRLPVIIVVIVFIVHKCCE